MAANLTSFDAVLKEDYLPPLRDSLNSATVLLKRLKRNEKDVFGNKVVIPIRYKRNAGVGARAEGGVLPDPGQQGYVETNPPLRYLYGRIQISGQVMKAARSDKGAFIRAVDSEIRGLETDFKRDINRQLFRAGGGLLGKCGTTTASTTVQLVSGVDMRWLEVGMKIDVLVMTTGAVVAADREITAISSANETITIDGGAITTTTTHGVYRHGARNLEMMGLDGIVNNVDPDDVDVTNHGQGSLQGLAVASYDFWKSTVVSNSGTSGTNATLDIKKIQQLLDDVDIASGKFPTILLCHHRVRSEYVDQVRADRRFVKDLTLDGGFSAVAYTSAEKELPLVVDRDCFPKTTLYAPDEEELAIFRQSDFDWMDQDGAILSRRPDEDAYEATLFCYKETGTYTRNCHGRLNDISVDA